MNNEESSASMGTVRTEKTGSIRVLTINRPPVNALSAAVRRDLYDALASAQTDAACVGVLIRGEGRCFMGGADIREFGQPRLPPSIAEVCELIENSAKLVVAAVHGACLGGGMEVALSCHYRIAAEDAKLGLPEVNLGLLPGAGGTQRAPRLVGSKAALDLMLTGRHAGAHEALNWGLVDRVVAASEFRGAAMAYIVELLGRGAGPRPSRKATRGLEDIAGNRAAIKAARASIKQKARGLFSPSKIIDAVEIALEKSFDEGMAFERAAFLEAMDSPQRRGLIHAFFSEREAAKAPEARNAEPRKLEKIGVIGGGTMGAGITIALLDAGLQVTMIERDESMLSRGRGLVEKAYDGLIAKGRMDAAGKEHVMARYSGSVCYEDLGRVDLVIEAVYEEMEAKKEVFAALDRYCKLGCVLATNTSYLDIQEIAASVSRPHDVIGLHFFSPANIMKLLEIVVPDKVSADVVATGFELARRMGKVAVRAGVCDGFIGNRILAKYRLAGDYLVEDGASPYQVDEAMREFGFAMGMFQVSDLAGGDIGWATRKRRAATRHPRQRYVEIADRVCEQGWLGQKTGRGFYRYPEGSRTGEHDLEVLAIVDSERLRAGVAPRTFTNEEIMRRIVGSMVNEGCRILEEKIALRPQDIDVVFLHGYGFPRYRGGPMHYADAVGLANVLGDLQSFAREDEFFWQPAPLLERLVQEGRSFADLE